MDLNVMDLNVAVIDRPALGARAPGAGPGRGPSPSLVPALGGAAGSRRSGMDLRSVIELVGAVAAPTTLLSGLAVYFGVAYVNSQAFYFGIDGSTLGYSTRDYVLRSADALFVPLGVLAVGGIVLLSGHAAFWRWAPRPGRARVAVVLTWGLAVIGAGLFLTGATSVFRPLPFRTPFLFAPVSLGTGAVICAWSAQARRRVLGAGGGAGTWSSVTTGFLVGLVVVIALFWATSEYARALGRGRSAVLEANLPYRPGVTLFSDQLLHLEGAGVVATELEAPGGSARFRYDGLRLFTRSGGKYFLLPADWSPAAGRAIVLADDERTRVEFTVGAPS